MMEGEVEISDQREARRSLWLSLFTVVLLAIVFGGIFFVIQKKSDPNWSLDNQISDKEKEAKEEGKNFGKKTLLELATAPENNPDFKPNPELTALVTAPRDPLRTEVSKINMDDLTAPSAEN